MMENNLASAKEIYICQFDRGNGEDCFSKGSKNLVDELKAWAKANPEKKVKVIRTGCLGKCESGIAAACYPSRTILTEIKSDEAEKIKSYLE